LKNNMAAVSVGGSKDEKIHDDVEDVGDMDNNESTSSSPRKRQTARVLQQLAKTATKDTGTPWNIAVADMVRRFSGFLSSLQNTEYLPIQPIHPIQPNQPDVKTQTSSVPLPTNFEATVTQAGHNSAYPSAADAASIFGSLPTTGRLPGSSVVGLTVTEALFAGAASMALVQTKRQGRLINADGYRNIHVRLQSLTAPMLPRSCPVRVVLRLTETCPVGVLVDQLQTQLQGILNRYHFALSTGKPNQLIRVINLLTAWDDYHEPEAGHEDSSIALLDSMTDYPDLLVAQYAITPQKQS